MTAKSVLIRSQGLRPGTRASPLATPLAPSPQHFTKQDSLCVWQCF